jgi:hypothetical protein
MKEYIGAGLLLLPVVSFIVQAIFLNVKDRTTSRSKF